HSFPTRRSSDLSRSRKDIAHKRTRLSAQPRRSRHGKTLFFPVEDFRRQPGLAHFFQQVFSSELSQFQVLRKRCGELHELVIQKGYASFERNSHAHFVPAREQQVRQPKLCVHV